MGIMGCVFPPSLISCAASGSIRACLIRLDSCLERAKTRRVHALSGYRVSSERSTTQPQIRNSQLTPQVTCRLGRIPRVLTIINCNDMDGRWKVDHRKADAQLIVRSRENEEWLAVDAQARRCIQSKPFKSSLRL
ncbi:hypothetical protein BDV10DRAFT_68444 [Aspergillus recurvatus]